LTSHILLLSHRFAALAPHRPETALAITCDPAARTVSGNLTEVLDQTAPGQHGPLSLLPVDGESRSIRSCRCVNQKNQGDKSDPGFLRGHVEAEWKAEDGDLGQRNAEQMGTRPKKIQTARVAAMTARVRCECSAMRGRSVDKALAIKVASPSLCGYQTHATLA
jgi:hypothetical protein